MCEGETHAAVAAAVGPVVDEREHRVGLLSLADLVREERRSPRVATNEDIARTFGGIDQPRGSRTLMTAA